MLGLSAWILFLHSSLSWAKSLVRLHFIKSTIATSLVCENFYFLLCWVIARFFKVWGFLYSFEEISSINKFYRYNIIGKLKIYKKVVGDLEIGIDTLNILGFLGVSPQTVSFCEVLTRKYQQHLSKWNWAKTRYLASVEIHSWLFFFFFLFFFFVFSISNFFIE